MSHEPPGMHQASSTQHPALWRDGYMANGWQVNIFWAHLEMSGQDQKTSCRHFIVLGQAFMEHI